jgi:hypothetical protein
VRDARHGCAALFIRVAMFVSVPLRVEDSCSIAHLGCSSCGFHRKSAWSGAGDRVCVCNDIAPCATAAGSDSRKNRVPQVWAAAPCAIAMETEF